MEKTKTESGVRFIPMSNEVYQSLKNLVANRKKPQKELMVNGYTGFLLLDKNGNPKVGLHLDHHMQWTMKKYRRTREEPPADDHTPCPAPHFLHQYGQCRHGSEKPAIPDGTLGCRGHHECLYPRKLRSGGAVHAENPQV